MPTPIERHPAAIRRYLDTVAALESETSDMAANISRRCGCAQPARSRGVAW